MNILVINCGSSSLKFQLMNAETEAVLAKGLCERIGIEGSVLVYAKTGSAKKETEFEMPTHKEAIGYVLEALVDVKEGVVSSLSEINAVGHRVVHGGEFFAESCVITDDVMVTIEECSDLAPLHNPANMIGIRACMELMPGVPMVAVFDTAFHQTLPEKAYMYALPYEYYKNYKVRRYGFHGTSHFYVANRTAELMGKDVSALKTIICHLGNGASASAVQYGKCVDTSMGLTPLEGLYMGTRCGDIDPAIIEFLAGKEGMSISEITAILNKKSGVYALSEELSSDFRDLTAAYLEGNSAAIRAIDAYAYKVAKVIGSYVAAMNGVDVIAFTAGIGENSFFVRTKVCEYLGYLGVTIDEEKNHMFGQEHAISTPDSKTTVLVVPTDEELVIARDTYELTK
ncbi:MAG: acetate kinase [Lachnospiraceae bacterium]